MAVLQRSFGHLKIINKKTALSSLKTRPLLGTDICPCKVVVVPLLEQEVKRSSAKVTFKMAVICSTLKTAKDP